MAKSSSAVYFLIVVMVIIMCLSVVVGVQGFGAREDTELLQDAERYANSFSKYETYEDEEVMEDYKDPASLEAEPMEDGDDVEDFAVDTPVVPVAGDIQAFDGSELQTFVAP